MNRTEKEIGEEFIASIKRLCGNKSYIILCNSYGLNIGVLNAVATLLNQIYLVRFQVRNGKRSMFRDRKSRREKSRKIRYLWRLVPPKGTGTSSFIFQNGEEDAGRIGLAMIITGMAGSVTFGIILDKTHKFK